MVFFQMLNTDGFPPKHLWCSFNSHLLFFSCANSKETLHASPAFCLLMQKPHVNQRKVTL